jgi:hypothetical protein
MSTRRDLLGFTAGAVAARTVLPMAAMAKGAQLAPPLSRDTALIAALAEFDAIERYVFSLYPGEVNAIEDDDERDALIRPLSEAQWGMLDRVCGVQARTLEGILARARTIVLQDGELDPAVDAMADGYTNERLVAALLRDLLAMGNGADV